MNQSTHSSHSSHSHQPPHSPSIDLLSLDNHPGRKFIDKQTNKGRIKLDEQINKDKFHIQELKHQSIKFIEKQFHLLETKINEFDNQYRTQQEKETKEKMFYINLKELIVSNLEIEGIGKDVYELVTCIKKELKRKEYINFKHTIYLLNIIATANIKQLESYPMIEQIPITKKSEESSSQLDMILINQSDDNNNNNNHNINHNENQSHNQQFFKEFRSLYAAEIDAELSCDDIILEMEDKELLDIFVDFIISSGISLKTSPQFKHERERIYKNGKPNMKRKLNEQRFYGVHMQRLILSQLQTKVLPATTINQDPSIIEDPSSHKTLYQLNPMIDLFIKYFPRLEQLFPNLAEQDETIPLGPKRNQPGLEDNVGILDQYIYKPRIDYADKRICQINPSNERHIKQKLPRKEGESHHDAVLRHKETNSKQRSKVIAGRTQHLINVPRVFTRLSTQQKKDQHLIEQFRVVERTYIKEEEPGYKGNALSSKQTIVNEYAKKNKQNYKCSGRPIKQTLRSKNNEIVFDNVFASTESPLMYKFYMYRPETYAYAFIRPSKDPKECGGDYYINQLLHENKQYVLKMFQTKIEQLQKNNKHLLTRYYQSQTGIIDLIDSVPVFKHRKIKIGTNQFITRNDIKHPHFDPSDQGAITNVTLSTKLKDILKYVSCATKPGDSEALNQSIASLIHRPFNKILPYGSAIKIIYQPPGSYDPYNLPTEYKQPIDELFFGMINRSEYKHINKESDLDLYNFLQENPGVYYDAMTKYYIKNKDQDSVYDTHQLEKEINSRLLFRADYGSKFRNLYAKEGNYSQEDVYKIISSNDITGKNYLAVDEYGDNVNDKTTFVLANKSIFDYNMRQLRDYSDEFYPVELSSINKYGDYTIEYYFPPHLYRSLS